MNLQILSNTIYSLIDTKTDVSNSVKLEQLHSLWLIYLLIAFADTPQQYIVYKNNPSKRLAFEIYPLKEKFNKWVNRKPT